MARLDKLVCAGKKWTKSHWRRTLPWIMMVIIVTGVVWVRSSDISTNRQLIRDMICYQSTPLEYPPNAAPDMKRLIDDANQRRVDFLGYVDEKIGGIYCYPGRPPTASHQGSS